MRYGPRRTPTRPARPVMSLLVLALGCLPAPAARAAGVDPASPPDAADRMIGGRCVSSEPDSPCGSLAESIRGWADDGRARRSGPGIGGSAVSVVPSLGALLTPHLNATTVDLAIAGEAGIVWWRAGAGLAHLLDASAYGLSLRGVVGARIATGSPWSVLTGARWVNVSRFHGTAAERPAQHLFGELGLSVRIGRAAGMHGALEIAGLLGADRRRVAEVVGAREQVEERFRLDGGASISLALWIR